MLKRTVRWSILMAVLGFILGMGFLVPMTGENEREPANESSAEEPEAADVFFVAPPFSSNQTTFAPAPAEHPRGGDVLFDLKTIASGTYAKGIGGWVQVYLNTPFLGIGENRTEILGFRYCHNYDFKRQRAQTRLNRYAEPSSDEGYYCRSLSLETLSEGVDLLNANMIGPVLSLRSKDFNSRTGGTLNLTLLRGIHPLRGRDYRRVDLKLELRNQLISIRGPRGESFDWLHLHVREALDIPTGFASFDLFLDERKVRTYSSKSLPMRE